MKVGANVALFSFHKAKWHQDKPCWFHQQRVRVTQSVTISCYETPFMIEVNQKLTESYSPYVRRCVISLSRRVLLSWYSIAIYQVLSWPLLHHVSFRCRQNLALQLCRPQITDDEWLMFTSRDNVRRNAVLTVLYAQDYLKGFQIFSKGEWIHSIKPQYMTYLHYPFCPINMIVH